MENPEEGFQRHRTMTDKEALEHYHNSGMYLSRVFWEKYGFGGLMTYGQDYKWLKK